MALEDNERRRWWRRRRQRRAFSNERADGRRRKKLSRARRRLRTNKNRDSHAFARARARAPHDAFATLLSSVDGGARARAFATRRRVADGVRLVDSGGDINGPPRCLQRWRSADGRRVLIVHPCARLCVKRK